jgi:DNA-binding transcriptional LysR family regulator
LLVRTTRAVRLTEAGARYLDAARVALAALDEGVAALQEASAVPSGTLRVTAPVVLGQYLLGESVTSFARAYPQLTVFVELSNRRADLVRESFDVAIRIGELPDSALSARRIGSSHTALFASPQYLSHSPPLSHPRECATHRVLAAHVRSRAIPLRLRAHDAQEVALALSPQIVSPDLGFLLDCALRGAGLVVLPEFVGRRYVASGQLLPALPGWRSPATTIHALFSQRARGVPKIRRFVDHLVATLPALLAER